MPIDLEVPIARAPITRYEVAAVNADIRAGIVTCVLEEYDADGELVRARPLQLPATAAMALITALRPPLLQAVQIGTGVRGTIT